MMKRIAFATMACLPLLCAPARADEAGVHGRIPVRVVVVTTFEIGSDTGDTPGEFQNWVTNFPLPDKLPFPQGYRGLRYNHEKQVLGLNTGEGPTHMAASITALANDPRFDVTHAYWLLAGIAGIDPNAGPAGSAAWAEYVVDGDLAYEIDAREIPSDWTTGYVPLGTPSPYFRPRPPVSSLNGTNLFHLNGGLVKFAYEFSHAHVTLPDTANLQNVRAPYTSFPMTQSPPQILRGDVLAAGTFWVGAKLNQWAENWVAYWSDGRAHFTMTSEEDAGYMQALTFLANNHQVDLTRVLDLRSASDFSVPSPGQTAAQLLAKDATGTGYSAFIESLGNVYLTGSSVVNEIATHWETYRDRVPGTPSAN